MAAKDAWIVERVRFLSVTMGGNGRKTFEAQILPHRTGSQLPKCVEGKEVESSNGGEVKRDSVGRQAASAFEKMVEITCSIR
jgi:hypothetical protein